jgi:hypothetical protein
MSAIPTEADNPKGLHQRYVVRKASGEASDPMATYFVLRLDGFGRDQMHIAACRAAARAYADFVQSGESPHLSRVGEQLRTLVDNLVANGA